LTGETEHRIGQCPVAVHRFRRTETGIVQNHQHRFHKCHLVRPTSDTAVGDLCDVWMSDVDVVHTESQVTQRAAPITLGHKAIHRSPEEPVGHREHDLVDPAEVSVDRGRVGAQSRAQFACTHRIGAAALQQIGRGIDDALRRQLVSTRSGPLSQPLHPLPATRAGCHSYSLCQHY
jgi:hypothetical protein